MRRTVDRGVLFYCRLLLVAALLCLTSFVLSDGPREARD